VSESNDIYLHALHMHGTAFWRFIQKVMIPTRQLWLDEIVTLHDLGNC
jgi:hypothetical protein